MASQRKRPSTNRSANRSGKNHGRMIVIAVILLVVLGWIFGGTDNTGTPESTPSPTITQSVVPPSTPVPEPSVAAPVESVVPVPEPTPEPTPEPSVVEETVAVTPPSAAPINSLTKKLNLLNVAPKLEVDYDRKAFGSPWKDVDENGCDTRNDILIRDFDKGSIIFKEGGDCKVDTGVLQDPYTGERIDFVQGDGALVDIDHVVALGEAARSGAMNLSEDERVRFANDPIHLLAVDAPANRQKGDKDASEWLPSNVSFRCEYVTIQINVKTNYRLSISQSEKDAIQNVIDTNC